MKVLMKILPIKKLQQKSHEKGVCTCPLYKFKFVRIFVRIFKMLLNWVPVSEPSIGKLHKLGHFVIVVQLTPGLN